MSNSKIYATRDSTTSLLRRMGVAKEQYNNFIVKNEGGQFEVNIAKAEKHLKSLVKAAEPVAAKEKPAASPKAETKEVPKTDEKPVRAARHTVSSVARQLILEGKTNEEVWKAIKSEFKLDNSKKHYPAWYRSELRRAGKLDEVTA